MRQNSSVLMIVGAIVICASNSFAQSSGPDVTISNLSDVGSYGQAQGITAFAVGTTACNVGNQPVSWISNTPLHPVIAQNMYRYENGKFRQVGMSWLKHGFVSTNSPGCGNCVSPPNGGSQLGVGCTDTYTSSLNGGSNLGPRSEVNAATGAFTFPHGSSTGVSPIKSRLQVKNVDLDPVTHPSARYFAEAQYVTQDDATAGNKYNNATWREIVHPAIGSTGNVAFLGTVHTQQAAIYAWQAIDPTVTMSSVTIPGDGRIILAARGYDYGYGVVRYEYCVFNMNSDRSISGMALTFPSNATIQNVQFSDVDYHSGEPYVGTDWTPTSTPTSLSWACETYAQNPNANALRWATMYSFSFESSVVPSSTVTLTLFKPGTGTTVTATLAPSASCPPQPVVTPATINYSANPVAPYDFVDISATGLSGPTGDDAGMFVNIGFPFSFVGTTTSQIGISTNGYLCLPGNFADVAANVVIPTAGTPNGLICGYWDDLNAAPTGGGSIKYQTIGVAPNRRFIVQYIGVWHYTMTAASAETFEIILDENGNISTTCVTTPTPQFGGQGTSATRGLEAPNGLTGIQVAGPVLSGTTCRYTPPTIIVPPSADLTISGNGTANSVLIARILGKPNRAVILAADTNPGPTSVGWLGTVNIGLSPAFTVIADGVGVFSGPFPWDVTDACGNYAWGYQFGPVGLPSGLVAYFQGVVMDPLAPNGVFHITTPQSMTVP